MDSGKVMLITGTRKGIGRYLAEYYTDIGYKVIGCSRNPIDFELNNYRHFILDVSEEKEAKKMFSIIKSDYDRLDVLLNNAGIASMNHSLLTPVKTAQNIFNTNVIGTFLFCREAARLMQRKRQGRIVNFVTIAVPLKLEGEAMYAASKAAVLTLTQILAKELSDFNITVNAVGPAPVKTDLIRSVSLNKLECLINKQAIHRFCEFHDISNVIDFFIKPESDYVTGQVIYLGGV